MWLLVVVSWLWSGLSCWLKDVVSPHSNIVSSNCHLLTTKCRWCWMLGEKTKLEMTDGRAKYGFCDNGVRRSKQATVTRYWKWVNIHLPLSYCMHIIAGEPRQNYFSVINAFQLRKSLHIVYRLTSSTFVRLHVVIRHIILWWMFHLAWTTDSNLMPYMTVYFSNDNNTSTI